MNTLWSPMRRQRQTRSSPRRTSSNVALPSGLADDQVISQMPEVPFIKLQSVTMLCWEP